MLEHSRGLALAANASGLQQSALEQALEATQVVLSIDPDVPRCVLTARVLLTTLRRMPGRLVLEPSGLSSTVVDELAASVSAIDPARALTIGRAREATVRLHIGTGRGDEAIRLLPEAHGAHIAGQRTVVIRPQRPASALGAIYTAALAAAETFKYAARVQGHRRVIHRHLRFCPVTLSNDLSRAPMSSRSLELALTLVGIGAIGTGIVLILSELNASGLIVVVDYEQFKRENRGTYSLGAEAEAESEPEKVALAHAALTDFEVVKFPYRVENLPAAIDEGEVPWTALVLSGLDSAEARRATQRLWPDHLIDAATGDTMLGLHEYRHASGPCMMCLFPPERSGPSAAARMAQITGLPVELLARGDDLLREEHLGGVSEEQRAVLLEHVGKPICGLARAIGLTSLDSGGFRPSVPFVSLQAASLAVGRLLVGESIGHTPANFVQYDALFGPQAATLERRAVTRDCYCQTNQQTIARVRTLRRDSPAGSRACQPAGRAAVSWDRLPDVAAGVLP